MRFELDNGFTGRADIGEKNQGAGLERVFDHSLVGDAGNEAECAFRADHQVGQDVDWVFIIDQCIEAVAGGVLDLEFVTNTVSQARVLPGVAAEAFKFAEQDGVAVRESIDRERVFSVEQGAVGQHDAHPGHGPVAVLCCAAAHPGGVVGRDAANFCRTDGSWIGADFLAERGKPPIHFAADNTGADFDF